MRRHLWLQIALLGVLALVSRAGDGWGFLLLYALLLLGLGLVAAAVGAARVLRSRWSGRTPGEPLASVFARLLSSFGIAVAVVFAAHLATAVTARFSDGPIGVYPGGALSGRRVAEPVTDWSFAAGLDEIQLEVSPERPRSLTTHFFLDGGRLYVGADFLFPFKQWVHVVQRDQRVTLRIRGDLHPARAVRVTDPQEFEAAMAAVARKRGIPREELRFLTEVWFFRMDPRAPEIDPRAPEKGVSRQGGEPGP